MIKIIKGQTASMNGSWLHAMFRDDRIQVWYRDIPRINQIFKEQDIEISVPYIRYSDGRAERNIVYSSDNNIISDVYVYLTGQDRNERNTWIHL